ncbi:MAG: maltose alpha-D-glucosyltransferase [Chloroflexi bacterium]|nr:maltose alpha-D-glucosyltransferase [Chloroflexota bacterium]
MQTNPLWFKDAIFYELNVRAFADGNGDGHGDFIGLTQRVDYLVDLGVDCVWLLPFYPSPLRDDGYDVSDYRNIAPLFGTLDDFKTAVEALHQRGIRVIIDLVINHTSEQHPWFIESRSSLDNPKRNWYVWSDTDQKYQETRIIFLDTEGSNWTFDPITREYYWHRFYREQPDLNFDNPEVQEELLDVMRFWLRLGIDGFRVDAVPYLFEREGTNCENLSETHEYIRRMRATIKAEYPECILLAEANQWPQELIPYLEDDEFDMAFHFPLMPRLFMGVRKEDRADIVHILEQTPAIPERTQWCVFLRNHDELTLEMVTEEQRQWMWQEYAPETRMRLNLGIRRRLAPLLENHKGKILLLHAIMFGLPGSPILYYGDEIGMGDNIWLRDRNGVRTPMQWDSSAHAGFSTAESTYEPVIDDPVYGYHRVNVETQASDPDSLLNMLRHYIRVRRNQPALGRGSFKMIHPENQSVFAFERYYEDPSGHQTRVLVVANLSGSQQQVVLTDLENCLGTTPYDLLTDAVFEPIQTTIYTIDLEPYRCLWLQLHVEGDLMKEATSENLYENR